MRKIFYNNKVLVIAFFTIFSVGPALAKAETGKDRLPVELTYNGTINNRPVYKLVVAGPGEYLVRIINEDKQTLFEERITGAGFTKTFLLNTHEMDEKVLYFEIVSKTTNQLRRYEISRDSHPDDKDRVINAIPTP